MSHDAQALTELLQFLADAKTSWHATDIMARQLAQHGYCETRAPESCAPDSRYYLRRGGTLIAFHTPKSAESGWHILGCHTDSPHLRLNTDADTVAAGVRGMGVSVYGGALLRPWFDRCLGVAGQVVLKGEHTPRLFARDAMGTVASLAIHLDRGANDKGGVNPHTNMHFIYGDASAPPLMAQVAAQLLGEGDATRIEDADLALYDTQPPQRLGADGEFIQGGRLDNLLSVHACLQVMGDAPPGTMLTAYDHEEVGSLSTVGAGGTMVSDILARLQARHWCSRALSVDNAHAQHPAPAYKGMHDPCYAPQLNRGVVVKMNANQRYAGDLASRAHVRQIASRAEIPLQSFVTRADLACGGTIGPIGAAQTGIEHLDIGVPQLAMHSVRELAGARDYLWLCQLLTAFVASELPRV